MSTEWRAGKIYPAPQIFVVKILNGDLLFDLNRSRLDFLSKERQRVASLDALSRADVRPSHLSMGRGHAARGWGPAPIAQVPSFFRKS